MVQKSNGFSTDRSTALGEFSIQKRFINQNFSTSQQQQNSPFNQTRYNSSLSRPLTKHQVPSINFQEQLQKYIPAQENSKKTFDFNFLSHRSGMNDFYKNKQYKVITQEGDLINNQSRALRERSRKRNNKSQLNHLTERGLSPIVSRLLDKDIDLQSQQQNEQSNIGLTNNQEFDPLYQASQMKSFEDSEMPDKNQHNQIDITPIFNDKLHPDQIEQQIQFQKYSHIQGEPVDYHYRQVKYIKLVPKKFKENYEVHFQDVFKKGQIYQVFDDQKKINMQNRLRQQNVIEKLQKQGHSCKDGNRKCSTSKQFDLVDVENQAFNNFYVEDHKQGLLDPTQPSKLVVQHPNLVKVSRYPRATLPHELKSRFEIDIINEFRAKQQSQNGGRGSTTGSIYENLYNDQFWRVDKEQQQQLDQNGQPSFQQFRPETCYRWSSPVKQVEHKSVLGPRANSMFGQYQRTKTAQNVKKNVEQREDLKALTQMGKFRSTNKKLWKFGGFTERPEWFDKMIMMASHQKRRCQCCNRFNCLKYLRQKTSDFREPIVKVRAQTVLGQRNETTLNQIYEQTFEDQVNQVASTSNDRYHQSYNMKKASSLTTQDITTKARVRSFINENQRTPQQQRSQSSIDSNKIINIDDPISASQLPDILVSQNKIQNQRNDGHNQNSTGGQQIDTMDYLVNQKRSVLYQYQQNSGNPRKKESAHLKDSIVQSSLGGNIPHKDYIAGSKFSSQDIDPNFQLTEEQQQRYSTAQINSDQLIEELIIKAHDRVKSWETSNEDLAQKDFAQIPISQNTLMQNIIKTARRESLNLVNINLGKPLMIYHHKEDQEPKISKAIEQNKNKSGKYNIPVHFSHSQAVSPDRQQQQFAQSIFKQYELPKRKNQIQARQQAQWSSPFQQRLQQDYGKKAFLNTNKAINMDRPKNHISDFENNRIAPGYISKRDFIANMDLRQNVAIHDPSLQYFQGKRGSNAGANYSKYHNDSQSNPQKNRNFHIFGPFDHKIDNSEQNQTLDHDIPQDKFNLSSKRMLDIQNDSLYQINNIENTDRTDDQILSTDRIIPTQNLLQDKNNYQNFQEVSPNIRSTQNIVNIQNQLKSDVAVGSDEIEFQNELLKNSRQNSNSKSKRDSLNE
eukprot:403348012